MGRISKSENGYIQKRYVRFLCSKKRLDKFRKICGAVLRCTEMSHMNQFAENLKQKLLSLIHEMEIYERERFVRNPKKLSTHA